MPPKTQKVPFKDEMAYETPREENERLRDILGGYEGDGEVSKIVRNPPDSDGEAGSWDIYYVVPE